MRKRKAHFWGIYSITNRIIWRLPLTLLVYVFGFTIMASAQSGKVRHSLGDPAQLEGWTGLEKAAGADAAKLTVPGEAKFLYQAEDGDAIGWEATEGRFRRFDPAGDWWDWPILALDVKLPEEVSSVNLTFSLLTPKKKDSEEKVDADVIRDVTLRPAADGWQTVYVPVEDFRLNEALTPTYLSYVRGLLVEVAGSGGENADDLLIDNVRLQRGKKLGLIAPVQSKSGNPGSTLEYKVSVSNCSGKPQAVSLGLEREGGEVIVTTVEPKQVHLAPGEVKKVTVEAEIPKAGDPGLPGELPQGARERWTLKAIPGGRTDLSEHVELIHVVRMEPPYITHSKDGWDEIRELVETEKWAKEDARKRINRARSWQPENMDQIDQAKNAAVAWQLTREKEFAEKVAKFFRMFADPGEGYPSTKDATGGGPGGMVHEGAYFRKAARSYDAVRDAAVFTSEDEERIETAFRIYMDFVRRNADHVGNHPLSGVNGALYSALAIQDWERVERFLEGPGGIYWQIRRGIMDDGWTVEVSTGYNFFCGRMFTKAGLALRRWGVEILEDKFPAVYHASVETSARPGEEAEPWRPSERPWARGGMYAVAWGTSHRNHRSIRDMWDSLIPLINEDNKVPGLNDAHGEQSIGSYDIAAYAYGDPEYIRLSSGRSLLYPVDRSEVDEREEDKLLPNYRADNAGVAMLRSQGVDSPHEQYQSVLKYGSHGLHHGHWDRLNLVYLRRFGKMATHTRTAWFSYGNIMYQMYVQTSMAHSMVVVDGKNQYPEPSNRLLYHTGDLFQAVAVENKTRWSNPRFGGHLGYTEEEKKKGFMEHAGHRVTIPEDPPEPGHMTDFTEPVRSRRAMAVTDEYVLVLDHVQGEKEHTYDALYQFRGFREFNEEADMRFVEKREKFDDSPLRAGQFVTNARIYEAEGPVRADFVSGYKPGESKPRPEVKDGWDSLHIDVHTAWPRQRKHIVSDNPQGWNTYSAARTQGREASFVTLIELQEEAEDRKISEVTADGPDQVQVELTDGRVHHWKVSGLYEDKDRPEVELQLVEQGPDGVKEREETAR